MSTMFFLGSKHKSIPVYLCKCTLFKLCKVDFKKDIHREGAVSGYGYPAILETFGWLSDFTKCCTTNIHKVINLGHGQLFPGPVKNMWVGGVNEQGFPLPLHPRLKCP